MSLQQTDRLWRRPGDGFTPDGAWTPTAIVATATILSLWAAIAFWIGVTGLASTDAPALVRPIALTAAIPVVLFVLAYVALARFRRFVLGQDLRQLTLLQAWRVVGFGFILLYAHQVLPGAFAWPAAVGDVLIGLTAPLMVARLEQDPAFAVSRRFLVFNGLGLLDFAVAVAAAGLTAGAFPALTPGSLTSGAMENWPLSLFPSFIVPLFIMLHLTVLLKARALACAAESA